MQTLQTRIENALKMGSEMLSKFLEPTADLKFVEDRNKFFIQGYYLYVKQLMKKFQLPKETKEYLYFLIAHDINTQYNRDCGEQPMGTDIEIIWLLNKLSKQLNQQYHTEQFFQSAIATLEENLNQCADTNMQKRLLTATKKYIKNPNQFQPKMIKERFQNRLLNVLKRNPEVIQNHSAHFWRGGFRAVEQKRQCQPLTLNNLREQTSCLVPISQNISHIILKKD